MNHTYYKFNAKGKTSLQTFLIISFSCSLKRNLKYFRIHNFPKAGDKEGITIDGPKDFFQFAYFIVKGNFLQRNISNV